MVIAATISYILKFPKNQIITISIETGIQNFGVGLLIIMANFPSPQSDYALISLMGIAFLYPLPLYIALIIRRCAQKFKSNKGYENVENRDLEAKNGDIIKIELVDTKNEKVVKYPTEKDTQFRV